MIPPHIKFYSEHGKGYFIDFRTGELYRLNPVGVRILESLQCGMSRDQLPDIVASEFTIGYDQAAIDIDRFLEKFYALA